MIQHVRKQPKERTTQYDGSNERVLCCVFILFMCWICTAGCSQDTKQSNPDTTTSTREKTPEKTKEPTDKQGGDRVVAKSGDWVVTLAEVDQVFQRMALFTPGTQNTGRLPARVTRDPMMQKKAIISALDAKILRKEIVRRNIEVDPAAIEREIASDPQLKKILGPKETHTEILRTYSLTPQDLHTIVFMKLAVAKLQERMVGEIPEEELWRAFRKETEKVTLEFIEIPNTPTSSVIDVYVRKHPNEIQEFWASNPRLFRAPTSRKVRVLEVAVPKDAPQNITTQAREKAQALRRDLLAGADFTAFVRAHSAHSSRESGGLLGYVIQRQNAAAFQVNVGEITEPVRTQNGWSLYLVEEEVPEHQRPLSPGVRRTIAARILRAQSPNAEPLRVAKQIIELWPKGESALHALLRKETLKIQKTLPFHAERGSTAFIPGMGREPALMDAAAGLEEVGQMTSEAVFARGSLWILRLKDAPKATRTLFATQRAEFEEAWRKEAGQRAVTDFVSAVRKENQGEWILGPVEEKYGVETKSVP